MKYYGTHRRHAVHFGLIRSPGGNPDQPQMATATGVTLLLGSAPLERAKTQAGKP